MTELPECPKCGGKCRVKPVIIGHPNFQKGYEDEYFTIQPELQEKIEAQQQLIDDLLAVLNHIAGESFDAMEGAGLPEFQYYEHWHKIAMQAIAKAEKQR